MIDGWPTHKGPLKVLAELGNIRAGSTPNWLLEPAHDYDGQRTGYKCRTHRGLGPQAILDLAALTVEGYGVYIHPRGRYARISIYEPEGP